MAHSKIRLLMEKELPKGWVETTVDTITASLEIGGRPKGGAGDLSEGIPSISAEHFNFGGQFKFEKLKFIDDAFFRNLKKGVIKSSDVLIVKDGATTGKSAFIDDTFPFPKAAVNEHTFILRTNEKYSPKLFFYFTLSHDFNNHILNTKGGSTIGGIKTGFIKNLKIPLPPLPEQERIVAKLDTLFAHLEQTKKRLEQIPVLLKQFRQAVLTQAVTGKLTGCKVEENKLGNLLVDVKYGTSQKSLYDIDGFPVFRIPNIKEGEIDDTDLKFSQLEEKEYNQLKLNVGDVLVIRSNGSISLVGKSAIIRQKHKDFTYAGYLIRLRPSEKITGDFLNYSLMSDFLRRQIVSKAHSSSGVNNINSQELKDLFIRLPSLPEQTEIVRRVESLFAKADAIEARYKVLKELVDQLPQAILGKAFRGEV